MFRLIIVVLSLTAPIPSTGILPMLYPRAAVKWVRVYYAFGISQTKSELAYQYAFCLMTCNLQVSEATPHP